MKTSLVIISLLLLISSCKKDITPENPYMNCPYGNDLVAMTNPTIKSYGFIPLGLTNYWIYSDSIWQDGVLQPITSDTLSIISAEKTGEDIWWRMSDGYRLCNSGIDTVYKLDFNGEVVPGTTVCPEKILLYFRVPADTIVQWTEWASDYGIPGEVKLNKSYVNTGAGSIHGYIEFIQSDSFGENIRCIKPGLGIIKTIRENNYSKTRIVRTLISYRTS